MLYSRLYSWRKPLLGLALGLTMLWACAGGALWQGARTLHYRWVRTGLQERSRDTILVTPEAEVEWTERDELRYGGRMFDVKGRLQRGDTLVLTGHFDAWDDALFGLLDRVFDSDSPSGEREKKRRSFFQPEAVIAALPAIERFSPPLPRRRFGCCPDVPWQSRPQAVAKAPPDWGVIRLLALRAQPSAAPAPFSSARL